MHADKPDHPFHFLASYHPFLSIATSIAAGPQFAIQPSQYPREFVHDVDSKVC